MDIQVKIRDIVENNGEALTGAEGRCTSARTRKQDKLQKQAIDKVAQAVSSTKGKTS